MERQYETNVDPRLLATVRQQWVERQTERERRYGRYVEEIHQLAARLPKDIKEKMSAEVLSKLASSLLDGTVFQIVRELEEIQQLKERNLLNGRMKMLSNHKRRRTEMATRHRSAITLASATERPRLVTEQQEEKDKLETELEADIIQSDQDTILSLDQLLTEQQSTLQVSPMDVDKKTLTLYHESIRQCHRSCFHGIACENHDVNW
jgi:hypothetical protein